MNFLYSPQLKIQKNVIPLAEQIQQFSTVQSSLMATMGHAATEKFLSKSLVFISIGSNDIFGYYHSKSSLPKQDFMSALGLTYENHLKVTFLSLSHTHTPTHCNLVWYFTWIIFYRSWFQKNKVCTWTDIMLIWQGLLNLGARKFGIISVPPIGRCPSQRIYNATGGCLEELNDHARAFHAMLDSLLYKLSSAHTKWQ